MAENDYLKLVEPWDVEEAGTLVETRIFSVRQRQCTSRKDPSKTGLFYYLDGTDWVNVVALTQNEEVVLIEQYRHGLGEVTLEIPGGLVDAGEKPLEAGLRELREETGYTGGQAEIIGIVSPNPAIQTNRCHTVLVRGVAPAESQDLDAAEEIETRTVPLAEISSLIKKGVIHHAMVVAAFHHLMIR